MIKCSFLKNKTIISCDIRLFKVKLLILPKMTIVKKGAFVSYLKITMFLAGKGYLQGSATIPVFTDTQRIILRGLTFRGQVLSYQKVKQLKITDANTEVSCFML